VRFSGGNYGDALQVSFNSQHDSMLIVQNCYVEPIHGEQSGQHADTIQVYGGPATMLLEGWVGETDYQGFFLHPAQFGDQFSDDVQGMGLFGDWSFGRVQIISHPRPADGKSGIPYYSIHQDGFPRIEYPDGEGGLYSTWTTASKPDTHISNDAPVVGMGNQKPGIWDRVQNGVQPPAGAIVLSGSHRPGLGYVSPGYVPLP
jgi:hypothetical protein